MHRLLTLDLSFVDPLVKESMQLLDSIKMARDQHLPDIDRLRQEIELHGNYLREAGQPHEDFNGTNPVCLPSIGDPTQRFINYIREDMRRLQNLLKEVPVNKAALLSEIDTSLSLWKGWFTSPRPDVELLLKGLVALREALGKDHSELTKEATSWRDAVSKRAIVVDKYLDAMSDICVSMNRITSTFEKQVTEQDHRKRGYMSRAQEIKAEIKKLEGKLEKVERDCSQEESSMKQVTSALNDHRRRGDDATAIRAQLELLSSQDRELLNQADTLINHVMPDGSGLSIRAGSLRDFLLACPSDM
jgi:predicted  nucleic acid-binding Zn-ribbon protein